MNLLDISNIFIKQAYLFLILLAVYIINVIIIRVLKKEMSKAYSYIIKGIIRLIIVSVIPALIIIYSSIIVTTNILAIFSFIISIIILLMESERFVSPLIKEVENANINNLGKVAINLLDIVPFILSIILTYSTLFLVIYPTNMTLINVIINISQLYLYIIVFDIFSSIVIFALKDTSKSANEKANYRDLLRNK
jgi:hypothetical protein